MRAWRALVGLGLAIGYVAGAWAQEEAQYTPPPEVDMGAFCAGVDRRSAQRYPPRALDRRIEGLVMLDCAIAPDGGLPACRTIIEAPGERGFGETASAMACFIQVPRNAAGAFQADAPRGVEIYRAEDGAERARITIEFKIEARR